MRAIGHKLGHLVDLDILQRLFPDDFQRYGLYGEQQL